MLSLGEAAKLAGVGKTTLARAIAKGTLSATRKPDGSYQVDVAELERVYPLKGATPATPEAVHHATPPRDPETEARLAALEVELRGLRALLDEVSRSRDRSEALVDRLTLALPAPASEIPRKRWRFW